MSDPSAALRLLTVAESAAADHAAAVAGVPGIRLMENAGQRVVEALTARFARGPVAVLCGPGNNGGDGFVIARRLAEAGWPVRLGLLGDPAALTGDAAHMRDAWAGPVEPLSPALLEGAGLAVDALFGAGLTRPLEGVAAEVIAALGQRRLPVVAVDLPSGIAGDTGLALGEAPDCALTVTFARAKPGHWLLPGRLKRGELVVADIGIPEAAVAAQDGRLWLNDPALWTLPRPDPAGHKYSRGHALVVGGGRLTGAGRLAARAARRVGAGLLSVAAPAAVHALYAGDQPGVMVRPLDGPGDLDALLTDSRLNAWLLGPGGGAGEVLAGRVLTVLASGRPVVLDADALTSFAEAPQSLFRAVRGPAVLTPHGGEFARLFPDLDPARLGRLEATRAAARRSGAVVVLKAFDSVVAAPDGRAVINANAVPDLASAGTGDVLAGFVLGLLAQGMAPFEATCAAVWLHGAAGRAVGPGLIAEDLPEALPGVLRHLFGAPDPR
ncbi:NAD(P)H-hydrate dehydratase [Roseospirillum parvum]|uniref:Bifunctional NAD(P)H-hydrate repair enzyme n=1 Tax=Roseospirillum parvum TaxID=83401 RepID=A0A1G7YH47_9PROT|nr:NAD(P)H-hydrate dehydratase [Roseospirillum parvum]SDG95684.1 NAD(P)H-hydrate epimerase [Roseospirillum parvum]